MELFKRRSEEQAETKDHLKPQEALDEEEGVLRRLASSGGGKVKKGIGLLMLGSALVLGAGSFYNSAEAQAAGSGTMEVKGTSMQAKELVDSLTKRAQDEKSIKEYSLNKRAAIDEGKAYGLSNPDRKKAIFDLAQEVDNPALQKGTRDGLREAINFLRHTQ